jgi:glycosyltransferase involved in cell wall biosynthesis
VRILWVVPRFVPDIVGGAERLTGGLARLGARMGWSVEIATTCAVDHETWADALPAGASMEDGVRVCRFPVAARDRRRFDVLHQSVATRRASYADELEWLSQGAWSPELCRYLDDAAADHDLLVFSPYLFGTTLWGAQVHPRRSALMPCLHDEAYAYLTTVRRVVGAVRGCLFNSPAERRLSARLYGTGAGDVVGMPFDAPGPPPVTQFAEARNLGPYLLYAGRLEEGKRVQVAVAHAVRYARERPNAPRLVLMGRGGYRPPPEAAGVVVEVGFVSEEEKRAVYREAVAVVNPSHLESLSLVLMEGWLEGTPALVAGGSAVMREHCAASGGGIVFSTYRDFRAGVDALLADPDRRARMGARGRAYVLEAYGAEAVGERLRRVVERLAA